jgi:hypothetical protein
MFIFYNVHQTVKLGKMDLKSFHNRISEGVVVRGDLSLGEWQVGESTTTELTLINDFWGKVIQCKI